MQTRTNQVAWCKNDAFLVLPLAFELELVASCFLPAVVAVPKYRDTGEDLGSGTSVAKQMHLQSDARCRTLALLIVWASASHNGFSSEDLQKAIDQHSEEIWMATATATIFRREELDWDFTKSCLVPSRLVVYYVVIMRHSLNKTSFLKQMSV